MSGNSERPQSETREARTVSPIRVDVRDVMNSSREIILVHRGQDYRLRITSNDKLILTK